MIPFHGPVPPPPGMFGISSLSSLYFFLVFLHGFRIWRRMIYMELEDHSEYEGPPLPFFHLIPGSGSFWFTRVVIEPLFVFIGTSVLEGMHIFQPGLGTYLHLAALMLAMKTFIAWYRTWEYVRKILDTKFGGHLIAKLVENKASESDLAPIHLAGLPKNISPEVRQTALAHIARAYQTDIPTPKGENHE